MTKYDKFEYLPVIPLGHIGTNTFFYFARGTRQVVALKPGNHGQQNFLSMAEEADWQRHYKTNPNKGTDWTAIGESLMAHCRDAGIYDPSIVRGRGAWRDGNDVVFHAGDALYINGAFTKFEDYEESKYRYLAATKTVRPADEPISTQDSEQLLSAIRTWGWEHPSISPYLLLGWIGCSAVCGALEWRPHLWITGTKGSGKSTLDGLVSGILGDIALRVQGSTTEPGLRQALNGDALPVLFDEFEAENSNAKAVIDAARSAASDNSAPMIKGTPEGKPLYYRLRFAGMFSGIIANIQNEADRSRFVILEMHQLKRDESQRRKLFENIERFKGEFGAGLLRRMLDALTKESFYSSLATLRTAIRLAGGDERKADVFAHLLAANHVLNSDNDINDDQATTFATLIMGIDEDEPTDEEACLSHLLGYKITVGVGNTQTIGEWLLYIRDNNGTGSSGETANEELERYGIKLEPDGLNIANATNGIKSIYARSRWADGAHHRILCRLPGASKGGKLRFAGHQSRCTVIPQNIIFSGDGS